MLRLIGSVTGLATLLVACGGGGDSGVPPSPATYTVGGTVSGLGVGQSVILQNNGGNDQTVSADGAFTFATKVTSGSAYAVTATAPQGEACSVTNGSGTATADVAGEKVGDALIAFALN